MSESNTSNLPSEVIEHIISLLTARDVVRSSVLSKQWKCFWRSNVNWRFTSSDYPRRKPEATKKFVEFINDVIFFHKGRPHIEKMSINLEPHGDFHWPAVMWINYLASNHPITELDLNIGPFVPPVLLFSCTSLVILRLTLHDARVKIPAEIKLTSLKELCLENANFAESKDAQRLLDSCSTLNKLEFQNCSGNPLYDMELRINLLELREFIFNSGSDYIHVHVAAMNLKKFQFRGRNLTMSEVVHFSFLKDVRIDEFQWLNNYRIFNKRKRTKETANKMLKTVSSLKMAEKILLGEWCTEHLSNILSKVVNLPTFGNLTSLEIEFWPNEYHANVVLHIIKCSPNLQSLHTKTCLVTRIDAMELLDGEVHLHLKHIEMDSFTGSEVEMRLVERLVGCCPQLRRLNINLYCKLEQPIRRAVRSGIRSIKKLSPTLIVSVLSETMNGSLKYLC
ncbi:F-box/LRR-repeat protein At3g26922-like [Carex rostrata]